MPKKVIYSILAFKNLDEIYEYIKQDSQNRAKFFIEKIKENINHLKQFPKLGKQIGKNSYIYLINKNYLVNYKIDKEVIYILSVKNTKNLF